jgi:transglutaminase-like putative cysteine protease
MEEFLSECEIIDFANENIQALAKQLAKDCKNDEQIARNCFLYVRDEIQHIGDKPSDIKTCKASEVLEKKIGWCYAKSHLLCALLRANTIPTALCYQRLSCGEYKDDIFCLHGLNAIYLKNYGWYRVDSRGNKEGVDAQFIPPKEQLAFTLMENEQNIEGLYSKPLSTIVEYLQKYDKFEDMVNNLPDKI